MDINFEHQVELAGFPPGVHVSHFAEGAGQVFRALQGGLGLEILLTDEAVHMYGEGPSVALVLTRLKQAAEAGLPAAVDGQFERRIFVGD